MTDLTDRKINAGFIKLIIGLPTWKFGDDRSSSFWDYWPHISIINKDKNKETNIGKTYSLPGKHARPAKKIKRKQWQNILWLSYSSFTVISSVKVIKIFLLNS